MNRFLAPLVLLLSLTFGARAEDAVFVYNWADYIDETLLPRFEKATGLKLVYDTFDSTEAVEERLLAGASGYDVVATSGLFLARQRRNNVFQTLDRSRLPNLRHLSPAVSALAQRFDPGGALAVPYLWGTIGLSFDRAKILERVPDAPLGSLALIFEPEIVERLADCGVAVPDSPAETIPAALRYLGLDPDSKDPKILAQAEDLLKRVRPFIAKFEQNVIDDLASGEVCLALSYSGDIRQAAAKAKAAATGVDIEYRIPDEGAAVWFDMLAIPADAANVVEAHRFLDYMLDPEVAAKIAAKVGFASPNAGAGALVPAELRGDRSIYPPPEILARLYAVGPYDARAEREVTRIWMRLKGRP